MPKRVRQERVPMNDKPRYEEFDSPGAFRRTLARLMGVGPDSFPAGARLMADWIDTPVGPMVAVADDRALHLLEFVERKILPAELKRLEASFGEIGLGRPDVVALAAEELGAFFAGRSARFTVPLAPSGADFAQRVWQALRDIPAGETRSYTEVAAQIGRPDAVRAVARANGANPIAVLIPCHRVIGADGSLTGYGGGLWRKQRLIDLERDYAVGLS